MLSFLKKLRVQSLLEALGLCLKPMTQDPNTVIVVGLGNPGKEYDNTRHNAGFWLLDAYAARNRVGQWKRERKIKCESTSFNLGDKRVILLKPLDYMNNSGKVLSRFCHFYKLSAQNSIIIYDDANIEVPRMKVTTERSGGGHNGVADIKQHATVKMIQFRIGVGPKPAQMRLTDFVLSEFKENEKSALTSALDTFINNLNFLINHGSTAAMNHINQRKKQEKNTQSDEHSDKTQI